MLLFESLANIIKLRYLFYNCSIHNFKCFMESFYDFQVQLEAYNPGACTLPRGTSTASQHWPGYVRPMYHPNRPSPVPMPEEAPTPETPLMVVKRESTV